MHKQLGLRVNKRRVNCLLFKVTETTVPYQSTATAHCAFRASIKLEQASSFKLPYRTGTAHCFRDLQLNVRYWHAVPLKSWLGTICMSLKVGLVFYLHSLLPFTLYEPQNKLYKVRWCTDNNNSNNNGFVQRLQVSFKVIEICTSRNAHMPLPISLPLYLCGYRYFLSFPSYNDLLVENLLFRRFYPSYCGLKLSQGAFPCNQLYKI